MESLLKFAVGLCILALINGQTNPVVETTLGKIKGSILKTEKGLDINAFRGIRYAQAPVGDKRFRAPVAVTKWDGELDATKDGFMCPQVEKDAELLSEDCLILNVYSRDLVGNRSVIFFIHGGVNVIGSSHSALDAGPEYIMDSDIVFVTLNYRLGALGFLSTRTKEAPGNYGYLDQVMALKWVQEHISKFGGNPMSVTILGSSSGAITITLHLCSPLSKGLFHKAIAMSGSATNHFAIDNLYWTTLLARQTSCPMFNPDDVLRCLKNVSWEKIIQVCDNWELYNFRNIKWNYEIDNNFLYNPPSVDFLLGQFQRVPILTGITKDEINYVGYSLKEIPGLFNDIDLHFDKYGPELLLYSTNDSTPERNEKIKKFYFGNKTISEQTIMNFGELISDSSVNHGVHRFVDFARKYVDVYYYRFDYVGKYGKINDVDGKPRGIGHADDLQYVLKTNWFNGQIGLADKDRFMVDRFVGWISSFAQTGVPQDVGTVKWLPSNITKIRTLYNDKEVKLGDEPNQDRNDLWDSLYPMAMSGRSPICAASLLTAMAALLHIFVKLILKIIS